MYLTFRVNAGRTRGLRADRCGKNRRRLGEQQRRHTDSPSNPCLTLGACSSSVVMLVVGAMMVIWVVMDYYLVLHYY